MADRCLLYYITNRNQFPGDAETRRRSLLAKVADAVNAGVDYIQLREKDLSGRELETLARDALAIVHDNSARISANPELRTRTELSGAELSAAEQGTRLLINSRTDIALATGAGGVHLRSDDMSPSDVRAIWNSCGPSAQARVPVPVIAVSCHRVEETFHAASEQAGIAVFAPVFEKNMTSGVGLAALHEACQAKIPVLALGGVTLENAASCLQAGAAGVAAIRLFQENKIEDVVRALRSL
jgi:thiamine-phosphate pyrophosphorylase